ncbi:MAG TPA: murein L,D-transpeptidase [Campylobacterales bacterium]|nr:murein L,D-transpeptidase [Campylobacterales bacterium]
MRSLLLLFSIVLFFTACSPHRVPKKVLPIKKEKNLEDIGAKMGDAIYMRIFKEENTLELWVKVENIFKLYKTYNIQKSSGKLGPKQKDGDKQNPEGIYIITKQSLFPFSKYHLAINIGYPNRLDRNQKRTGNAIMIHGGCQSIGCFAMGDPAIEEIYTLAYNALDNGQKFFYVAIYPFRMQEKNLKRYKNVSWYPFWQNLKEGYEIFNKERVPPQVSVKGKKYIFKTAL